MKNSNILLIAFLLLAAFRGGMCAYKSVYMQDVDYTVTLYHEHMELKTIEDKTVYSGTFNPDSNSIEQAIINDNL